ncbi:MULTISPECIES: hypothetical protein [Methylobacterium]|uniref:Uncharacterized protein n=2 Tax=Methylobacterium TaxID=407 RepID=A0A2U8W350_9HYPH|nr:MULTISPECIES: hypothetical protein [Methylobacterium]AWN40487.1 hypothetical protein DK389_08020 [Methylobacterium durans]GEP07320.1 hypothetical protein MOX02_53580 [Methylobacterium oxalidis]GJE31580.1 hypothetical protein LDDCCGHA_1760 [Methylobacterium oxalidis]GLS64096.1 hypothetical protein GCM10007888_24770 [Methylobacterium oxalidis]
MDALKEIYGPFFHPEAKLTFEADMRMTVTLPDGRSLMIGMDDFRFHNPNAEPLPRFEFREHSQRREP